MLYRTYSLRSGIALALLLAVGCSGSPDQPVTTPGIDEASVEPLTPQRKLIRASMVIRGIRPTLADLQTIGANPLEYENLVDSYLDSPEFGATIRQYVSEWFELDQAPDTYPAGFPAIGDLAGLGSHELNTSIIQAGGRLAEHIVTNDLPWSDLVTADYTLADFTVATVWGLPYDDAAGGWQVTKYEDGRPNAGILSDGWMFTRMPSTEGNRNRERAALVADALICHDYPGRPVAIPADLDLTSESAITNAIESNPVCVSCHNSLDPLAAFFSAHYALRFPEETTSYPLVQYTPEEASNFETPNWYGQPAADLGEMGQLVAEDPRFVSCAVRRFYSELMHIPLKEVSYEAVALYRESFVASQLNVRQLIRSIVLSPQFGASAATDSRFPWLNVAVRRATPQQLDSMIKDLTGYQWTANIDEVFGEPGIGEVPLLRDFLFGYRTLAGGPNSFDTIEHTRTANPTTLLVLRNLAERAAASVVEHDSNGTPILLTVSGALEGEEAAVSEQLAQLVLRFYGEQAPGNAPELARLVTLYEAVYNESGDTSRAWEVVLAAMLQDIRILFY